MKPIRQQLMEAIQARLESIRVSAGYLTDVGINVFHWRDPMGEPFQPHEKPCCFIRDASSEITPLDSSVHEHSVAVEIGALVDRSDAVAAMRDLEADLMEAIGQDKTFGGLCHYFQPSGAQADVKTTGEKNAVVRIQCEARYRTPSWNAFTLHTGPA